MSGSYQGRSRRPPLWAIAIPALALFWFVYGLRGLPGRDLDDPIALFPFVLAGLTVVAGIGLIAGGRLGRVVAAIAACAGAAPVVLWAVFISVWAISDPHGTSISLTGDSLFGLPTWIFIALVGSIVTGYGLVLARAIRGRPRRGPGPVPSAPPSTARRSGPTRVS